MKFTGLDVFDSTIQRTNIWLKELMQELNSSDHRNTYMAFRSVLHALRDHLPVKDAIYVGEQLPMLIRGLYFEHWQATGKPAPLRNRNEFVAEVSNHILRDGGDPSSVESAIRAVFRLLDRKAMEGEIESLEPVIPSALLELWPRTLRAA